MLKHILLSVAIVLTSFTASAAEEKVTPAQVQKLINDKQCTKAFNALEKVREKGKQSYVFDALMLDAAFSCKNISANEDAINFAYDTIKGIEKANPMLIGLDEKKFHKLKKDITEAKEEYDFPWGWFFGIWGAIFGIWGLFQLLTSNTVRDALENRKAKEANLERFKTQLDDLAEEISEHIIDLDDDIEDERIYGNEKKASRLEDFATKLTELQSKVENFKITETTTQSHIDALRSKFRNLVTLAKVS